jgi:hypothetical protein
VGNYTRKVGNYTRALGGSACNTALYGGQKERKI